MTLSVPEWITESYDLYQNGLTLNEISKQSGMCRGKIYRGFKKYELSTKKVSKLVSNDEVENIADKYKSGITLEALSTEYGVTIWTVRNILKVFEVETLTKQGRKTLLGVGNNYEYFDDMTKEGPAYFYGLLLSDGNLYKGSIQIGLHQQDKYILETLKEELNLLDNKIKDYDLLVKKTGNTSKVSMLRFMDKRVVESLRELGFAEKKSGKEVLPEKIKYNRHFWRGMIDGDGFVSTAQNKLSVGLIGSKEVCEGFLNFSKMYAFNIKAKVRKHSDSDIYTVVICSSNAEKVLHIIYEDSNFFLERKKYKVPSILQESK
jgi:hypothetical protein